MDLRAASFPHDFLWGVATSAYQIEGAVREDGRAPSIWDTFAHTAGKIEDGTNGDIACDHYHRLDQDIALMRELGVQAYRFSIAWPRILPNGSGAANARGLDFYDRLVDGLLAAGITPFATLYHWDLPQALQDRGGWLSRDTAKAFADYADIMIRRLGDRVKHWATHNEPWCTAFLGYYHGGIFPPGVHDLGQALQVSHHLLLSHGMALPALRASAPQAELGIVLNTEPTYPYGDSEADQQAAHNWEGHFHRWFLDPLAGRGYPEDMLKIYGQLAPRVEAGDMELIAAPIQFLGINYYSRKLAVYEPHDPLLKFRSVQTPRPDDTSMGWEVYPEGLYDMLARIHRDYSFPALYITENGSSYPDIPDSKGHVDDGLRETYLQSHFAQAARLIEDGVPLKGYFVWSLMDNFEWSRGYKVRFGIIYVDYASQQRTIKRSGLWYRDWIGQFRSAAGL